MDASLLDRSIPASADLTRWMPAVRNQLTESDCTCFALCAVVEAERAIHGLPQVTLSPAALFYEARKSQNEQNQDVGLFMTVVLDTAQSFGIPPEADDPYVDGQYATPPDAQAMADAPKYAIKSWQDLTPYQPSDAILSGSVPNAPLVNAFRKALSEGHPVCANVCAVPLDNAGPGGSVTIPADVDQLVDHEVAFCAYDDATQTFRIENSWGTGVGDGGFFLVPYDYVANLHLCNDGYTVSVVDAAPPTPKEVVPVPDSRVSAVPVVDPNGNEIVIAYDCNGETIAPVRDIVNACGGTVTWDAAKGRVIVGPKS